MKNVKYKLLMVPALLILTLFGSCKKSFLDAAPYAVVADNNFYQTTEQCKGAVMQAYNRTVHLGPVYLFIRHALNDYAGDDLLRTQTDDFTVWYNFSPDNVQFLWGWKYCFQGIYLCNYTLSKLAIAPIPQADKDALGAECKTIRALMYYMVATRWGQTPIITDILPIEQYYKVAYSKAADVYVQVIKDLKDAIPNLPKKWDAANKGRFSQSAAKMLLAKTYMQLAGYPINKVENWQLASDVLADFVPQAKRTEYGLGLLPNYGDVYSKAHDQDIESVFEVNEMYYPPGAGISLEVGAPGNFLQVFEQPDMYEGFGAGRECFTKDLYDEFEKDNEGKIVDKRFTYTMLEPGDVFYVTSTHDTMLHNSTGKLYIQNVQVNKATNTLSYTIKNNTDKSYAGWVWPGKDQQWYPNYKYLRNASERTGNMNNAGIFGEDLNVKWMRFSDAILNYAECLNETGHTADAAIYVNEVRTRTNNSQSMDNRRIYQKTIVTGALPMVIAGSQVAMRAAIQHESRVELAGEDWRYENLRRWGIAEDRLHQMAAKSPLVGSSLFNPAAKYIKGAWDYYPVPTNEFKP